MLAYLDDVATTVTDNVVTVPLSTEEIEIIATDLEQGLISSYTFINNVTQTQYADFTIAVPSGVTVSGTTISGEVDTETYTITVTPDPVASTVTAKIDNVETTVTANTITVPVSATSVEITVVADGYVSATKTYTNEVEQATSSHTLTFVAQNPSSLTVDNTAHTITDTLTGFGNGDHISVKVAYDGVTISTNAGVAKLTFRLYVNGAWTGWQKLSGSSSELYISRVSGAQVTKIQAKYTDGSDITTSKEYSISVPTATADSTYVIEEGGISSATVVIDETNKTVAISGGPTDDVVFSSNLTGTKYFYLIASKRQRYTSSESISLNTIANTICMYVANTADENGTPYSVTVTIT